MKSLLATMTIVVVIGSGAALAQTPAPASSPPAAGQGATDKKAISKACSDQANAKGLHGKARKQFRSECRRSGGKPM